MRIEQIRRHFGREIIDYQSLIIYLNNYARPREKISNWLSSGDLIRVKKGLYVFGRNIALEYYPIESVANLMYGPSAISLNYALSYYGLIPERTESITSITTKRNKAYDTSLGKFRYYHVNFSRYSIGLQLNQENPNYPFLIASPEKALVDQMFHQDIQFVNTADCANYLFEDLRIDISRLRTFDLDLIREISLVYKNKVVSKLYRFLRKFLHA